MPSVFEECMNCNRRTSGSLFCSLRCRSIILQGTSNIPGTQGKKQGPYAESSNATSVNSINSIRSIQSANSASIFHFEYDSSRESHGARPRATASSKPQLRQLLTTGGDSTKKTNEQLRQYTGFFREAKERVSSRGRGAYNADKRESNRKSNQRMQSSPAHFQNQ